MLEGIQGVSSYAEEVDRTFWIVNGITLFLFIITIGSMLYFVYRYRASKNPPQNAKNIEHYTPIEIAWTVIPTILLMFVFYIGLDSLRVQRTMPLDKDSIIVKVLAQKGSWNFQYENGKRSPNLIVPIDQNIKLEMSAPVNDVIHSLYIPAFRLKEDVLPGVVTKAWFNANTKGVYDIQCAEYCGTRHSFMRSEVKVVSMDEYKEWLNPTVVKEVSSAQKGKELFEQYGCTACHSIDGSLLVGPSLKDSYNQKVKLSKNGETIEIIRDENYLKDSILNANQEIVDGFFPNMMPSFEGVISDKEVDLIIEYIKSIGKDIEEKETIPTKPNGEELTINNGCLACHSLDGTKIVGPSFKGIWQRKQKVKIDGTLKEIIIDEEYLKQSIINPNAAIVDGYPALMPTFKPLVNDEELKAIIEYLKTIK